MASQPAKTFEQTLGKYSGRNNFSENTNLDSTQFRQIVNFDLFSGGDADYLRTRRGSTRLIPEDPITQLGPILNRVVFPFGGEEYLICAYEGEDETLFSYQSLLTVGNPIQIKGSTWNIHTSSWLSNAALFGVTQSNSTDYTVYYDYDSGTGYLGIYSDDGFVNLVGHITLVAADSTNVIEEDNSSGLYGTIKVGTLGSDEDGSIYPANASVPTSSGTPDMKICNNRVYVFSIGGNKVISWDAGMEKMVMRDMGLEKAVVESISSSASYAPYGMPSTGMYYYGLEKVIRLNDADVVASSTNRKLADGSIPLTSSLYMNVNLVVDADSIDNDPSWTHIRLWRSKNTVPDTTNPLFPVDAQGVIGELYEVALITRVQMFSEYAILIPPTGNDPAGNLGVGAGMDGGQMLITDGNADDVLDFVVDVNLMELIPIPGCRTGDANGGRIFASGIGSGFLAPTAPYIDPSIAEDVIYTTELYSEYQEQWDGQAYLNAGRDGKKTTGLFTLNDDLIVIREGQTRRVQQGNIDAGILMVDDKIGASTFRMVGYIPGLGLCAICSDKYLRYLDYGLEWRQVIGNVEISQSIYDLTSETFSSGVADFAYINGKLILLLPAGNMAALHVKEGKGWTELQYASAFYQILFAFSSGQRAAITDTGAYLLEIETEATTDDSPVNTEETFDINAYFETYGFSGKGKLLEPSRYSFWGALGFVANVTAKVSGSSWVMHPSFQDPGLYLANTGLNEREYRFEPQPKDTGYFKWVPLRGQFISFLVETVAPAMISWQKLAGKIRDTNGNQTASVAGGVIPQGPGWANSSLMLLNFEDPGAIFYDASGKGVNHTWNEGEGGSKVNRVSQKPGYGLHMEGGGFVTNGADPAFPLIGSKTLTWKVVFSLDTDGSFQAVGNQDSTHQWWLYADGDTIRFSVMSGATMYRWTTPSVISQDNVYVLTFVLKSDYSGQFYVDDIEDSFAGARATTRTTDETEAEAEEGHSIYAVGTISYYQIEKADFGVQQAARFFAFVKNGP